MDKIKLVLAFNTENGKTRFLIFSGMAQDISKEVAKNLGENIASNKLFKDKAGSLFEEFVNAYKITTKQEVLV